MTVKIHKKTKASRPRHQARRRKPAGRNVGERIIAGLTEVRDALASGKPLREQFTVRTYRLIEPGTYDAAAVRRTRERLHASQTLFAKLIGASPGLVRAWEIGN